MYFHFESCKSISPPMESEFAVKVHLHHPDFALHLSETGSFPNRNLDCCGFNQPQV